MNILIIAAHPDPESFNLAIANTAKTTTEELGHTTWFHDLHAEAFDPILPTHEIPAGAPLPEPIATHCHQIARADGIIIVHPNWWGMPPAILKGWIDRVVRPEVAYRFLENDSGQGVPQGLLKARRAIVINTANTPPDRERSVFGDPLERIWKDCVFGLCGVTDVVRETFAIICTSTPAQREQWLNRVQTLVTRAFPA